MIDQPSESQHVVKSTNILPGEYVLLLEMNGLRSSSVEIHTRHRVFGLNAGCGRRRRGEYVIIVC